jgi:hypothetical protein
MLWAVGAGLAAITGLLSLIHALWLFALVYGAVAGGLALLAVATRRENRGALAVSLVLLGSQLLGVLGAGWELHRPDADSAKARHLRDLGLNYRWSIFANLVYSLLAGSIFVWSLLQLRNQRTS